MEVNPLSIILVKSDSKGDRLLFRYPFNIPENSEPNSTHRKNPYTLPAAEDLLQSPTQPSSNIVNGNLTGFTDEVLSSLFAVKTELCGKKFELKVNDVRFVGHPTLVQLKNREQDDSGQMQVHVVFALQALASHSVVTCYHELSERFGSALVGEEKRRGYLNDQTQAMTAAHDDGFTATTTNAFETILAKCTLAQLVRKMHDDLCSTGVVDLRVGKKMAPPLLTFCLPQKVHQWHFRGNVVEPQDIDRCLKALRPYHTILLLYPVEQLIDFAGCNDSNANHFHVFLEQYSPLKNLLTIADDADLTLSQIFQMTGQLVYWAKATVIFPICSTNKYVIASDAPLVLHAPLVDKFADAFPSHSLIETISHFALPVSLGHRCNALSEPEYESHLVKTTIWMLQHHLLIQLHVYVQYCPSATGSTVTMGGKVINTDTPSENIDSDLEISLETHQDEEELLLDFPPEERDCIMKVQAAKNSLEDLKLFARLCRKGYFQGEHHLEEIMYLEKMRRSQLLQILDKFRDVLVFYETEDSAIALFSY